MCFRSTVFVLESNYDEDENSNKKHTLSKDHHIFSWQTHSASSDSLTNGAASRGSAYANSAPGKESLNLPASDIKCTSSEERLSTRPNKSVPNSLHPKMILKVDDSESHLSS